MRLVLLPTRIIAIFQVYNWLGDIILVSLSFAQFRKSIGAKDMDSKFPRIGESLMLGLLSRV